MTEKKRESDHPTVQGETGHTDGVDYNKLGAEHGGSDFERRDVNPQNILLVTLIGVVSFVVILIGVSEYFLMTKEAMVAESVLKPTSSALRDLRAQEDEILNSYKSVDASKSIYQIPISEAMKRIADEAYQTQKNSPKEKSDKKK